MAKAKTVAPTPAAVAGRRAAERVAATARKPRALKPIEIKIPVFEIAFRNKDGAPVLLGRIPAFSAFQAIYEMNNLAERADEKLVASITSIEARRVDG